MYVLRLLGQLEHMLKSIPGTAAETAAATRLCYCQ